MKARAIPRMGVWFMVTALCMVSGAGCTSPRGKPVSEYRETALVQDKDVTLSAGDSVEFKFFYAPELNELQTIRPDGKVMLQLVGDIVAAGKTPEQLQADLQTRYRKVIEKPSVAVMVRQLQGRVVYVSGSVMNPGKLAMPGNMTVLDAIMHAGGFKLSEANVANVIVVRMQDGKHTGYSLNLEDVLTGKDVVPFYMHSQDIVYVPRTKIVDVDEWISQYFYKLMPQLGLYGSPFQTD